jgi:DNA polymerase-1
LRYDLASVAQRHLGKKRDKGEDTWRKRYEELLPYPCDVWPEDARSYAIDDAVDTFNVYRVQAEEAETLDNGAYFFVDQHAQTRADWWLHLTSVHGIMTSPDALEILGDAAREEIEHLETCLVDCGLVAITYHKHKAGYHGALEAYTERKATKKKAAVIARVEQSCAEQNKKPRLTKKDGICTDRDACLETGDPLLEAYIDYASAIKTLNSDVKAYAEGTVNPLHTRFESLAATGRTTSSGPNIQNVRWNFPEKCTVCRSRHVEKHRCLDCGGEAAYPPGIRECFVPRPGTVFASADYEGLELRTLAQVCLRLLGHSRLAEVLNAGQDPHLMVASQILGRPYDWCLEHIKDPDVQLARQTGKVANFGFPGGLGADKLVLFARMTYRVRMTVEEARKLKRTWVLTFPEFGDYFKYIDTLGGADGTFNVQHLFSNRLRAGVFYCVACNSFFQGLGADAAKAAGYLIARACYYDRESPLYGCRIVNFVHDEWILEVPDDEGHVRATAAADELARLMIVGAEPYVPDVPMGAEPQLMRRWSKKAKRLVNKETGMLIPWDLAA